jgi:MFS superfamily sulfate permease-like transporter
MESRSAASSPIRNLVPADSLEGLKQNWKDDLVSGLLVSLIALPLCLGIAMASGFPAFGGLITAIVGGLIVGPLCGSRLSIKGPAAGLIAIAIASVEAFGKGDMNAGYRCTLAVLVVAAAIQMVFALLKWGRCGDFFPASVVHGMLAAIGVIIFSKQIHPLLGVKPVAKEPLPLLVEIPHSLSVLNPEVALVGVLSVLIILLAPKVLGSKGKFVPAPLLAVLVGVGLSIFFDFTHPHTYHFAGVDSSIEARHLVTLPAKFLDGITMPDFSQFFTLTTLQYVLMFSLIGSIESLLTVKAVDAIDPFKRRSDMNRDLLAVGCGNFVAAWLGGLPMISEVVRSYANTTYGAKTRWANFFHGACLLVYAVFFAAAIHYVPVAALAGILCVTGYRLAAPTHFKECRHIGPEQLVVFTSTIIGVLMTDLLVGVVIGVIVQLVCDLVMGVPLSSVFWKVSGATSEGDEGVTIKMPKGCSFANVIGLKRALYGVESKAVHLDFTETVCVDHSFAREVHAFKVDAEARGIIVHTRGFELLEPVSEHPQAARRVRTHPASSHSASHR